MRTLARAPSQSAAKLPFASLDLDLVAPAGPFRGQGHPHLQHSIFELGLYLLRLRALGQGDGAFEPAITPLAPVHSPSALLVLLAPLPLDQEASLTHLEVDVLARQSGQVGADDQLVSPLTHLDLGQPGTARHAAPL